VPNERLVRWYVTVGLVDPPLSRRGRVAQYGRRHLLQLVAVKRRQAEGRSLAEIQAELAGATDEALAAVARVPDARPAPAASAAAPARFWARQSRQPSQPVPTAEGIGPPGPAAAERPGAPGRAAAKRPGPLAAVAVARLGVPGSAAARGDQADHGAAVVSAGLVHGIRLAPGVTLLLEGAGREPGPDDVTEILNTARPLLEELASRRLRASGPGRPPDVPGQSPGTGSSPRGAGHDH
jgi:hypothetical protein